MSKSTSTPVDVTNVTDPDIIKMFAQSAWIERRLRSILAELNLPAVTRPASVAS